MPKNHKSLNQMAVLWPWANNLIFPFYRRNGSETQRDAFVQAKRYMMGYRRLDLFFYSGKIFLT